MLSDLTVMTCSGTNIVIILQNRPIRTFYLLDTDWYSVLIGCSVASHWQILSHNVVPSIPRLSGIRTQNISGVRTDCISSYKSNYHTITTTMAPLIKLKQISILFTVQSDIVMQTFFFLSLSNRLLFHAK